MLKPYRIALWTALIAFCITVVICAEIVWQSFARGQPFLAALGIGVGALMVLMVVFTVRVLLWDAGRLVWRTRGKSQHLYRRHGG